MAGSLGGQACVLGLIVLLCPGVRGRAALMLTLRKVLKHIIIEWFGLEKTLNVVEFQYTYTCIGVPKCASVHKHVHGVRILGKGSYSEEKPLSLPPKDK